MMLARVEYGPNGFNVQTFEWCAHVQKMLVEYVLKSVNTGWMASGLKPPN